jgi:hypothetical protein
VEFVLPVHKQNSAPVAIGAGAPKCRRADDEDLLPVHLLEKHTGDKS